MFVQRDSVTYCDQSITVARLFRFEPQEPSNPAYRDMSLGEFVSQDRLDDAVGTHDPQISIVYNNKGFCVCFYFLGFCVLPWTTCLLRGKLLSCVSIPCCFHFWTRAVGAFSIWNIVSHCGQGRGSVENHGLALKALISK